MRENLLAPLGNMLRRRRQARKLTQSMLASRVGRGKSRISELETDLQSGATGRDRLGLLAELCDVLDLVPMLIPREQAQAVQRQIEATTPAVTPDVGRVFDDVFVDLSDEDDDTRRSG